MGITIHKVTSSLERLIRLRDKRNRVWFCFLILRGQMRIKLRSAGKGQRDH